MRKPRYTKKKATTIIMKTRLFAFVNKSLQTSIFIIRIYIHFFFKYVFKKLRPYTNQTAPTAIASIAMPLVTQKKYTKKTHIYINIFKC